MTQEIKQTPIHNVPNPDILKLMRSDYSGVVEVGSSSGAMAQAYREINPGCGCVGIEIDADYVESSRQYCNEVIYGDVEKLPDDAFRKLGNAQCWIFGDALEHLYDSWKMLRRVKSNARSGLEVIACIPNSQYWGIQSCLNSGMFVYQDAGLLDRTHLRWLTRITIIDLFLSSGFKILEMNSRLARQSSAEMIADIQQIARAYGADPDMALRNAFPCQYVLRAVSVS